MIVDDESDGHMSDDTDDSDDCSDVEPEAATAKDPDRNSENSTNSALECEDRCSLHEEQSSLVAEATKYRIMSAPLGMSSAACNETLCSNY